MSAFSRDHLQRRVTLLSEDEDVWLLADTIGEPADEASLRRAQDSLAVSFPPSLLALYRGMDGARIAWSRKDNPACAGEQPTLDDGVEAVLAAEELVDGALMIPTLDELCDGSLEEPFAMLADDLDELGFTEGLPFDLFHFFTFAAVVWSDDVDAHVVLGDDHGACWTDHPAVPLSQYLDLVLSGSLAVSRRTSVEGTP